MSWYLGKPLPNSLLSALPQPPAPAETEAKDGESHEDTPATVPVAEETCHCLLYRKLARNTHKHVWPTSGNLTVYHREQTGAGSAAEDADRPKETETLIEDRAGTRDLLREGDSLPTISASRIPVTVPASIVCGESPKVRRFLRILVEVIPQQR